MEDASSGDSVPSDESPAQKQARLRRERREAKIKAGGSARLDKITKLSGRSAEAVSATPPVTDPALSTAADTGEGDKSNHQYPARTTPGGKDAPTEADIRQLLRSAPPAQDAQNQQQAEDQEDPMVRLLQQMIGGMPGAQADEQRGGLPPGLGALLGGGGANLPSMPGQGQKSDGQGGNLYLWKVIHAIFAFLLGIYMTAVTTFNGAQFSRVENVHSGSPEGIEVGKRLFWIFATAEVVLQGSRFVLERGKTKQAGWMGMLMQVLPEPWRGYVGLVARYGGIWTTVVEDAMAVVFVLGCAAWWRGLVS